MGISSFISGRMSDAPVKARRDHGFLSGRRPFAVWLLVFALWGCSNESGSDYLAEGRKLMEQGNPGGAVVLFKSALEKYPADFDIRLQLSRAYIAQGKAPQAEAELQKCLRQKPDDPALHFEFAKWHILGSQFDAALQSLQTSRQKGGNAAEILEMEGIIHGLKNEPQKVRAAFEEALRLDPERESAVLGLARLHIAERNPAAALELVDKYLAAKPRSEGALLLRAEMASRMNDDSRAVDCYTRLLESHPKHQGARYMLGSLLLQQGERDKAAVQLAFMQREFGDSAMTRMLEGLSAYYAADYAAASHAFQRSLSLQPSLDAYYRLALSLLHTGNLESALSNARKVLDFSPDNAAARQMICSILLRQNRLAEARQEAELLLERYPESPEALFLLGSIRDAGGDKAEAVRLLERALRQNPDLFQASIRRSAILMAQGKDLEAEEGLKGVISRDAENMEARGALFTFYVERRNLAAAEQALADGLAKSPDSAYLLTLQATLRVAQDRVGEALEALARARAADPAFAAAANLELRLRLHEGNSEKALEVCDSYLGQNPRATDFLIASASLLDLAGRTEDARTRLQSAFDLGDQRALFILVQRNLAAQKPQDAEALLASALQKAPSSEIRARLAAVYLGGKKFDEAWKLYETIEGTRPEEAAAGKYRLLSLAGRTEQALEEARRLAGMDGGLVAGMTFTAYTLERAGLRAEALEELQRAYGARQHPGLLLIMAGICARGGDLDKAEAYYRTVLQQEKDNSEALAGQAAVMLARGRYASAIEWYERALRVDPDNALGANNLAMAYIKSGNDPERALRFAVSAYARQPENPGVLDTLGVCLLANKRFAEAVPVFERAVLSSPPSPSLLYRLASALAQAGRPDDARVTLQQALELGKFPEREQAEALLQSLDEAAKGA